MDGNFKEKKLQVGANANQNIEISIDSMNADALGLGKEQVKQGGTTPTAVKYQGMSYTYDKAKTAASNKASAISNLRYPLEARHKKLILQLSMTIRRVLFITRQQLMEKRKNSQMLLMQEKPM